MFSKRKIINLLFVAAFPMYGVGAYLQQAVNFTVGNVSSILLFLLIVLFHGVDLMYQPRARRVLNANYWLGLLYLLTLSGAHVYAYFRGFPGIYPVNLIGIILAYVVPFHATLVVVARNRHIPGFELSSLILLGLVAQVILNLVGYVAGFSNVVHHFDGRMNLPFFQGIYDGAHILAVINLMLLFHLKEPFKRPIKFMALLALFMANMTITMSINSRLSFMIFLLISVLFITRSMKRARFVYTISLFTLPLLMSFSLLIYQVLSMPVFEKILQRVDKEDVVTFNGRTYIWASAYDWLLEDRRGLILGNGYQGQYHLGLLDHVAVLWGEDESYNISMHSSFLQVLLGQGIVGVVLLYIIYWRIYKFYRMRYIEEGLEQQFYAPIVYMLFIWQMDPFCFGMGTGAVLTMAGLALISVQGNHAAAPSLANA